MASVPQAVVKHVASVFGDSRLGEVDREGRVAHDALAVELAKLGDRLRRRERVQGDHVVGIEFPVEDLQIAAAVSISSAQCGVLSGEQRCSEARSSAQR